MIELNDKQIAEYFHRSYAAVDGLWFMKMEEKYGFDAALEIDTEVWKIMPKIQGRMLNAMGKAASGIDALLDCFTGKLALDGFEFEVEKTGDNSGFRAIVHRCPWHDLIVKAGRKNLAERVGTAICKAEYPVWAAEFGDSIRFEISDQICKGSERCLLKFEEHRAE